MAKVIIEIEDTEDTEDGGEGQVRMSIEFEPEVLPDSFGTPAQALGMRGFMTIQDIGVKGEL